MAAMGDGRRGGETEWQVASSDVMGAEQYQSASGEENLAKNISILSQISRGGNQWPVLDG